MAREGVSVDVKIDNAAVQRMLHAPEGEVVRYAGIVAGLIKTRAKELVGYSDKTGPAGHLRDRIVQRLDRTGVDPSWRVGAPEIANDYAMFHHEGTAPHPIEGNPLLVFFWANGPDGARVYYFRRVNHPGTKPNRFLVDAAHQLGLTVRVRTGGGP